MDQVRQRVRAIPNRQESDSEVPEQPRDGDRRGVTEQRHFKYPRCKHEEFEWRRWWQKRRNQHSHEAVAFHPMPDGVRMLTSPFVEERFPALSRNEIQHHATQHRSQRGHERIQRHPCRMLHRQMDQQQIVDDRKCQHGRVQKGNQKKSRRAKPARKRHDFLLPSAQVRRQSVPPYSVFLL